MRLSSRLMFFFMILTGLWSCGPRVSTSSDSPDLSRYRTYAWRSPDIKTSNPKFSGDIIDREIRSSVEAELREKGYVLNNENPDFYVTYHTYTEQKIGSTPGYFSPGFSYPYMGYGGYPYGAYGWGGYGGYGGYYGGGYYTPPTTYTYTEGTLVLDFIDARTNRTIWRGSTEDDIDNEDKVAKKIDKGVHSILKRVPDESASM